ncbi:MlaA family lipoprotein [Cognatiyoonia sp.]|uniref:MlaA family lipoprotein n=1 Tax=Cognatiyoonia sp. TaxID=2211652 RepID=UPI003F69CEFF
MNRLTLASAFFGFLAACTPAPNGTSVFDPYEAQNRKVHAFNKGLDKVFFSGGGDTEIPEEIAIPVANFADNVGLPGMVLNGLLQADIGGAATNTVRFLLNTTLGLGGLLDPASEIGLDEVETDFGETLAVWGVPEGAYLELPVLGPSTERALAGRIVDAIIDPLDRVGTPSQIEYGTVAKIAGRIVKRSQYADTIDSVLRESADSYAQQRLIYLQNRRFELGTTSEEDAVDPYDDL